MLLSAGLLFVMCEKQPEGNGSNDNEKEEQVAPKPDPEPEPEPQAGEPIRVMTFNIRTSWSSSDYEINCQWENRRDGCFAMLREYQPVVVGFNELKPDMLMDMNNNMGSSYSQFEGAFDEDDCNYIFYRKDLVAPVEGTCGKFWLSPTPDERNYGWESSTYYRTCIYTKFKMLESGNEFWFFVTHPTAGCQYDVFKGLELIAGRIKTLVTDDTPVFLGGDMNCKTGESPFIFILKTMANAREIAPQTDDKFTYNDWGERYTQIDHIFVKGKMNLQKYECVDKKFDCAAPFISDHFPIYVDAEIGVDACVTVPELEVVRDDFSSNVWLENGYADGQIQQKDVILFDNEADKVPTLKFGTANGAAALTIFPPRIGDIKFSFYAFAWNRACSKLRVSVDGDATIDGKKSVEILPRPCLSGTTFCIWPKAEDRYDFELKNVSKTTRLTITTLQGAESEFHYANDTPEFRSLLMSLNVSGGEARPSDNSIGIDDLNIVTGNNIF